MNGPLCFLILGAILTILIYNLYRHGFIITKQISAILFVFRPGKNSQRASLDSCTGWVRHAGRFRDSRTYTFAFDVHLSKGDAGVLLLDGKKREILRLNRSITSGKAKLSREQRYYLH